MAHDKSASKTDLERLHGKLARYMEKQLDAADTEDGLPLTAADLGVIAKFLKDNEVSADPAGSDDLARLRDKFSKAAQGVTTAIEDAQRDEGAMH